MATYYIRKNGSNSNAGTSAGAAWLTIGKALASGSPVVGGDTIWVGAGVYRETITVGISPSSAVNINADVDGLNTGDAGEVWLSGYDAGETTLPSTTTAVLSMASTNNLAFSKFSIQQGGNSNCLVNPGNNCSFTDCTILGGGGFAGSGALLNLTTTANVAMNLLVDRCRLIAFSTTKLATLNITRPTTADFDYNITFRNCQMVGQDIGLNIQSTGANTFNGGGIRLYSNDIRSGSIAVRCADANLSTSIPAVIAYGNLVICDSTGMSASTSGQITEDYNVIMAATARSNVTAGTHSKSDGSIAPRMYVGQESVLGLPLRFPWGTPSPGSGLLGFGSNAAQPTVDMANRQRPAGGASASYAVGALELHDYATAGGSANADGAAGNCIQLSGPGDYELQIPVDAVATTISIKEKTIAYVGTNYPQITLLANGEIGVATQTVADTAANTSYTTLTLAAFTPTAKGTVTLRLQNRTGDGAGIVYFDTLTVA